MMLIEPTTLQNISSGGLTKILEKTFMYRDCPKDNEMVTKKFLVLRTCGDSRMILKWTKHNKKNSP